MGRSFSKRFRFKRDVISIALTVSVLAVGATGYFAVQAERDISEHSIENVSATAAAEFSSMRTDIASSLEFARDYGASGLVSLSKPENNKLQLLPFFNRHSMLSGIAMGDQAGRSYFILPDGTERLSTAAEGFDPRERPWFKPEEKGVYWSEQYEFHTLRKLGITASTVFYPEGTNKPVVVAFDVLLDDLYAAIKEMAPSENSELFSFAAMNC